MAHNGEINTLAGNRNWMRAREACSASELLEGDLSRIFPIVTPGASDSATLRRSLGAAPPRRAPDRPRGADDDPRGVGEPPEMDPARRAFYGFHASLMEPWDGPAAVAFTDGTVVGAVLDRNGLRPARYWVTDDGLVVLASEVGVLDLDPAAVVRKGRLQPGRMFLVDTAAGRIVNDDEIKAALAAEHPYARMAGRGPGPTSTTSPRPMLTPQHASVVRHQRLFGYTNEELRLIIEPMARSGSEPIGSMGSDTPIAVLSERPRLLYDYFTQLFAQVTNPPLDAIREELVTSLRPPSALSRTCSSPGPASCRQIVLPLPGHRQRRPGQAALCQRARETPGFKSFAVDGLFRGRTEGRRRASRRALDEVRRQVSEAIALGRQHHRPLGPQRQRHERPDPVAAADGGGPPPPGPGEGAHQGRPGRRERATPVRCTTSPSSSATGRPRSTRTWPSSRSPTWSPTACSGRVDRARRSATT